MATKKQKRDRLARAEAERREQERLAKRARTVRTAAIGVGAVVVVAAVIFAISWLNKDKPVVTPDAVTAQGGIAYPAANQAAADAVEVVVYEDPLCSHCRDFETDHGAYLQKAADHGDISLEYRPIALISDDSVAPVNAMACVLDDAGPKAFVEFHDRVFAGEYADSDFSDLANESGADGQAVAACIDDGTHDGWVEKVTSDASDDGVEFTPTVRVNGETIDVDDLDDIETLIEEAAP